MIAKILQLQGLGAFHLPARLSPRRPVFANIAQGTHAGYVTVTAAAAFAGKFLLATAGEDAGEVDVCGVSDCPVGVVTDEADDGDPVALKIFGVSPQSVLVTAAGAISAGAYLYTAASGRVQGEPATAGTYYLVGRALTAATGAGDRLEAETCVPVKLVVLAALTSTDGTAAAAADLAALKAEAEKIGDDVRALAAAVASPALLKVLAS